MTAIVASPDPNDSQSAAAERANPLAYRAESGDTTVAQLLVATALPVFLATARRYRSFFFSLRPTIDADDFVQTCAASLLAAFHRPAFDEPALRFGTPLEFIVYARRLSERQIIEIDRRRRADKRGGKSARLEIDVNCLSSTAGRSGRCPAYEAVAFETLERLTAALAELSAEDSAMLNQRIIDRMSYAEIAAGCGRSVTACRTRIRRLRNGLRETFRED